MTPAPITCRPFMMKYSYDSCAEMRFDFGEHSCKGMRCTACMFDLLRHIKAPFNVAGGRFRFYWQDWRTGLHRKVFSSALLIFFTSVGGPAMSFGEYLSNNLEGSYGVLEVLVTTALCGTIFSLISGSPLVIVGPLDHFLFLDSIASDWRARMGFRSCRGCRGSCLYPGCSIFFWG